MTFTREDCILWRHVAGFTVNDFDVMQCKQCILREVSLVVSVHRHSRASIVSLTS